MKTVIQTDSAPKAIGPYSQAISCQTKEFVFCSGQVPLNPITMQIVGTTATEQAEQVLKNLKGLCEASGTTLQNVVKVTMFLKDMNDFGNVNEVYSRYFSVNPPARSTVEVARLPKDVLVEMEAIATKG